MYVRVVSGGPRVKVRDRAAWEKKKDVVFLSPLFPRYPSGYPSSSCVRPLSLYASGAPGDRRAVLLHPTVKRCGRSAAGAETRDSAASLVLSTFPVSQ